ncbi:MAG: hypothetical protein COA74_05760 [Gammaproteobacteria bacterium]|nr:MAG: hypothetical protein COA74_05760 [Gammaproteobacteria bacterium]
MNKNTTQKDHEQQLELQIAELKNALRVSEAALRESQATQQKNALELDHTSRIFESIVDLSPIPMIVASTEGRLIAFNKVCLEQLGIADAKAGMLLSEFKDNFSHLDSEGKPLSLEQLPLLQSLKGNVTKNKELCVIRKDGTKRWQIASSHPIYDKDGNVIAGFVAFPDITQRVVAETLLAQSEEKYRKIFDNANISIWDEDFSELYDAIEKLRTEGVTDLRKYLEDKPDLVEELSGKIKIDHINEATLSLFGVENRESFFDHILEFFGPDTLEIFKDSLYAIWDKKPYFRSEANYVSIKGEEIKAIISYVIPENRQGFYNVPVSIIDITEFKYQQDRLNSIVDALPDLTFVFDEEGLHLEVLVSKDVPFYKQVMSCKGQFIHEHLPKDKADFFVDTISKTLAKGEMQVVEYELDLPRGTRSFEGRVSPMKHTYNNKQAVVWLAVDITEHRKVEKQFRQAQKMEAVGILTGGIAHEFNNLLSPILGYTELLLTKKSESDSDYNGLNQIFIASNRAKILVQQLLAYGRQSMSQRESIELSKLLEDVLKFLVNTLPANIRIHKDIQLDLPLIEGMPNELHQIILNLCVNASHAMPEGGDLYFTLECKKPPQAVEGRLGDKSEKFICLTIRDTGIGMDKFVVERIFDPFFTTKEVGQGSGLGLSVVEGILEQHNGAVEVVSSPGEGSSFLLYFPVSQQEIKAKQSSSSAVLKASEHILLIDDDSLVLDIAKNMLEMLEYKVTAMTDSEQALATFGDKLDQFDLVIVDYGMPRINGKIFAQRIKQLRADIPIILCTGYGDLIAKENIAQWGLDDVLLKPFAFKDLSAVVSKVLA